MYLPTIKLDCCFVFEIHAVNFVWWRFMAIGNTGQAIIDDRTFWPNPLMVVSYTSCHKINIQYSKETA